MDEGLQPSPEPSPDDLSSPNPDQAAPLLQAQQRPPSRAEREETRPGSASGTGKMDAETIETAAVKEGADAQSSVMGTDREQSEQERTTEKDSERDRIEEEKDCEDKEDEDRETADEGLPPSKGSEDESEEESEEQKETPDANNNSLETPQEHQEDFIDVPDPHAQVGLTDIETGIITVLILSIVDRTLSVSCAASQVEPVEETYCSDEIEVVLVDNSVPGPVSARLDDSDTVKIIITMSCDPQTAAQLEESVKQSLLENAQVRNIFGLPFRTVKIIVYHLASSHICPVSTCFSSLLDLTDL